MKEGKSEFGFLLAILIALVVFFSEIVFLKQGFFSGDHRAQHYPWAYFYAQGLKEFRLPWWTTYSDNSAGRAIT